MLLAEQESQLSEQEAQLTTKEAELTEAEASIAENEEKINELAKPTYLSKSDRKMSAFRNLAI